MEDVNKFRTSRKDRNHTPRQEGKITQVKVAPDDITVWGNLKRGVAQTKTIKKKKPGGQRSETKKADSEGGSETYKDGSSAH